MTTPNTIIADMAAEIDALRKERDKLMAAIISINCWSYPDASTMPNDKQARLEWYARRLVVIANAAKAAMESSPC